MLKQSCSKHSLIKNTLFIAISSFSLLASSFSVNADTSKKEMKPTASVQLSSDAYELKLGLGEWTENNSNHAQLYVSHFKAEDTLKMGSVSASDQKYTSTRIGFDVNGFGTEPGKAYQGGVFLYSNESQANIDRYGVGVAFSLGHMLTKELRLQAGVELMPEFLSSDWDAKALLEYELNAGATYRITPTVDAGVTYRYGATLDDINVKHYNQLMVGLSLKL